MTTLHDRNTDQINAKTFRRDNYTNKQYKKKHISNRNEHIKQQRVEQKTAQQTHDRVNATKITSQANFFKEN